MHLVVVAIPEAVIPLGRRLVGFDFNVVAINHDVDGNWLVHIKLAEVLVNVVGILVPHVRVDFSGVSFIYDLYNNQRATVRVVVSLDLSDAYVVVCLIDTCRVRHHVGAAEGEVVVWLTQLSTRASAIASLDTVFWYKHYHHIVCIIHVKVVVGISVNVWLLNDRDTISVSERKLKSEWA